MKLRCMQIWMQGPDMSGKEPVERGVDDQGDHQTSDAVGGRLARWQPSHHPKGWKVTAWSPMCKQWADKSEVLQQSDTMSSDTA